MVIWMIGQAKHYIQGQVSTPDIRELIGSVVLARGRAFSSESAQYVDMHIRPCDSVFFLFFTTGRMSSRGWKLLASSGVIGMDGDMVAAFLADAGVGVRDGRFDEEAFKGWIRS
jgi:restriction endonuclease Mrr